MRPYIPAFLQRLKRFTQGGVEAVAHKHVGPPRAGPQPIEDAINMPWSSTRGTPHTFVARSGWVTDHSKQIRTNRVIATLLASRGDRAFAATRYPLVRSATPCAARTPCSPSCAWTARREATFALLCSWLSRYLCRTDKPSWRKNAEST